MNGKLLDTPNNTENGRPTYNERAESAPAPWQNLAAGINYDLFLRCIHCGLCTSSCPTFLELGDENDGPRGRIRIMRMIAEKGDRSNLLCNGPEGASHKLDLSPFSARMLHHLELCLDCRGCETACASGVQYSRLIEPMRLAIQQDDTKFEERYDWFREVVLFRLLPYADRMRRLLVPMRFFQHIGIFEMAERLGLLGLIPGRLGRMIRLLPPPVKQGPRLPKFLPAVGRKRARVAFFVGCVADALFRQVHWATLRVLQQNGCDIFIPPEQGCCGALLFHAGESRRARQLADANLVAFELDRYDAIVVNHAGCGAMLKQYGLHWKDGLQPHREKFAAKVKDVHEYLDGLGLVPPGGRSSAVATYHDACHLTHAQGINAAPRRLLAKIPGLELRELPEADICCGAAGAYMLNEPEMAERLARRKMQNIQSTGASIVLAADPGCLLHLQRQARAQNLPLKILHPMELLDLSYRSQQP
jgi:glycolate oxidase iron-sulfur subunit